MGGSREPADRSNGVWQDQQLMSADTVLHDLMLLLSMVAPLVGGGAIFTAVITQRAANTQRRIDMLRAELQEFYGPLGFLAASTRLLSEHRTKLVHVAVLSATEPHDDPAVRTKVGFEAGQTIQIGDKFNERIVTCNREIYELLRKQYHLIDPADLDLFHSVMLDLQRMQVECADGHTGLPPSAYVKAGILLFTRDDFTDRVKARLDEKRRLLNHLLQPWWKRLFRSPASKQLAQNPFPKGEAAKTTSLGSEK
jgi:hypothetical protein